MRVQSRSAGLNSAESLDRLSDSDRNAGGHRGGCSECLHRSRNAARDSLPFPSDREFHHKQSIGHSFDRFTGETVVSAGPFSVYDDTQAGTSVRLGVIARYRGQELAAPPAAVTVLADTGQRRSNELGGCAFLRDGERVRVNASGADPPERVLDNVYREVWHVIDLREFLQMIAAKTVEGRCGYIEFAVPADVLEAWRDFATRLNPDRTAASRATAAKLRR